MPVFLNEAQAGRDREVVGFPHLLICMGVVLQTPAFLYGYHFDGGSPAENARAFAGFVHDIGGDAANGQCLYGCGDWTERFKVANRAQAWRDEMRTIARTIGYRGLACGFDTSIIGPQNGTYVEYRPDFGKGTCRIYYKRDEKVGYVDQTVPNNQRHLKAYKQDPMAFGTPQEGRLMLKPMLAETTSATIPGKLHEVDYARRLVLFTI